MKFIDLFCGIGGFHQALKELGCECVLACDIDKDCREIYKLNYDIEPISDITKLDETTIPDFDILTAGFPCQPFSNGGKKKTFDDKRGLLFDEIIRIAKYKNPKFMFLENVKHILRVSNGKVFEYIKDNIEKIGYTLQIFNLSPHNYGIPQQRERIFFICIRNDIYTSPIELYHKNKNLKIDDIINNDNDNMKYKINKEIEDVLDAWNDIIKKFEVNEKISPVILINDYYRNYSNEEFEVLPKWKKDYMTKNKPLIEKYKDLFDEWYNKHKDLLLKKEIYGKLEWQTGIIKPNEDIYNHFIQFRQSGIRIKKNKYFPTLVAIVQIPIYGKLKRYITPRECARLQSFPEDFIISNNDKIAYKQFGNSVNVYNTFIIINSTFKHYDLQ
jgi:DNA (cytosine-5)-methyltransferase 1